MTNELRKQDDLTPSHQVRSFDWNLIKSFLAVLDEGTLSSAAKILGISQPTLTRHINELENALGILLFERDRNGARPTSGALAISDNAREINAANQALCLSATGKSQELHGTIRITASQIVATYLLPRILAKFLDEAPEISVELVATDKVENLNERHADIAIRMARPQKSDLIARKVNEIGLGIYAHANYLSGRPPVNTPTDLNLHCIIGYDIDERIIVGMAEAGMEVDRNYFRLRCDDQVACWQALCEGVGIGFAPNYLAKTNNDLVHIAQYISIPTLPVWLVTHKQVKTNRRIRMVFDFLAAELADLNLD
ncbi:MAG: LysR family transcriptional regulator [Hyphomicrobiales bacterium]|nr:LysR family transcriptional regulator [Hyphomicrobiales bacterium]